MLQHSGFPILKRREEKKRAYQMSCVLINSHHPGRRGITITPNSDTHGLQEVKLRVYLSLSSAPTAIQVLRENIIHDSSQ